MFFVLKNNLTFITLTVRQAHTSKHLQSSTVDCGLEKIVVCVVSNPPAMLDCLIKNDVHFQYIKLKQTTVHQNKITMCICPAL